MHDRRKLLLLATSVLLLLLELQQRVAWNRPRLSAKALVLPSLSPWTRFFNCGDDRDFMMLVGLDRRAFAHLLVPFSSEYGSYGMNGKLVTSKYASHGNRVLGAAAQNVARGIIWGCAN